MSMDPAQPVDRESQDAASAASQEVQEAEASQEAQEAATAPEAAAQDAEEESQAATDDSAEPDVALLAPAIDRRARASRRPRGLEAGLLVGGLLAVGVALVVGVVPSEKKAANNGEVAVNSGPTAVAMPACSGGESAPAVAELGDPRARRAAQKGLDYLASAAAQWQSHNNCYGCHVQAVTVEALAVGIHHQYSVARKDTDEVLRGMLDLTGGARQAGGLNHSSSSIGQTGKLLGGAAFARYDQWVDDSLRDYMLTEAQAILSLQGSDGRVDMPWISAPVATGAIQATAHAIVTWKQAYERTADDQWLTAISRAEDWLRGTVASWREAPPASMQELNYAAIALIAAGVSNSETVLQDLTAELVRQQNTDGGFPLHRSGASSPFATGQTLYVLRLMSRSDSDPVVVRGTSWLIERQQANGSWSSAGFGKAEAMWAVLGLVSVDVLSLTVERMKSGQHVSGTHDLAIEARDNKGNGVAQVEVFVDDIRVAGKCGGSLQHKLATASWSAGKHMVEIRATNTRGQVSRRFLDLYAGDVYLTQIGTRYAGGGTEISLRNIIEADRKNKVTVEIYSADDHDGKVSAGTRLHSITRSGHQGSMSFSWNGEGAGSTASVGQKYVARLKLEDENGKEVQSEEVVFVHDTLQAQKQNWAQLEGQLALPDGVAAQNAEVELVDEIGRVVGSTKSTRKGKFRFRNVQAKKGYKVRVKKKGFSAEAKADALQGEDNEVNLNLQVE